MSYDYVSLRDNVAFPLIKNYGTPIEVLRSTDTSMFKKEYDPLLKKFYWINTLTNERFENPPEDTEIVIPGGYGVLTRYKENQIDGSLVKRGDILLLAINIPHPQLGDSYKIGDSLYKYIYCDPVAPGNVAVVYKIQIGI